MGQYMDPLGAILSNAKEKVGLDWPERPLGAAGAYDGLPICGAYSPRFSARLRCRSMRISTIT